ncbi:MAG TPA: efflux RND transporter periplasmic adaptor subunit [Candidatus Acidoferrales bacterium]|nr:efflux RND transporter periplasmic adaptor subunit [Candidatus Acidoferrales bacterium]
MSQPSEMLKDLRIDRSAPARSNLGWVLLVVVVVALAAAAGWWWFGQAQAATVRTAAVQESAGGGAPGAVLNATGYVTARRKATLAAKITGKLTEVNVEEGMHVKEGHVVARLEDTTSQAELAWSKARLEAARKALTETEVRLAEARRTLERTKGLTAQGIKSQADLDADQAEVDSLEARLRLQGEEVKVAEGEVALRIRLWEDSIVRAPFSGVVISKDAQVGEMVSPISAGGGFTRTGICTIVDMKSLEIEVDVNEAYIARVQPEQKVEAILDAYPEWRIPAHVITTIPSADRQKATVKVRVGFDQLDPRILPDMGVKVSFLEMAGDAQAGASRRLFIPRTAVRREGEQTIVYVVKQGRLERRAVRLGAPEGEQVVVLAGVTAGEQVVTEGPNDLSDGARVVVR